MKIQLASVTRNRGTLRVVLAQPLTIPNDGNWKGYTPEGLRLLRVLYKHAYTGHRGSGRDNSIEMGWAAANCAAINTQAALQAELDRYVNVPIELTFSKTRIYAAGPKPSNPTNRRELREARARGCQIQPHFRIKGNLPMTGQDNDRLAAALSEANIPAGVYGPLDEDVHLLGVTIYMPHRPQDTRDPWTLVRNAQAVARRVIV